MWYKSSSAVCSVVPLTPVWLHEKILAGAIIDSAKIMETYSQCCRSLFEITGHAKPWNSHEFYSYFILALLFICVYGYVPIAGLSYDVHDIFLILQRRSLFLFVFLVAKATFCSKYNQYLCENVLSSPSSALQAIYTNIPNHCYSTLTCTENCVSWFFSLKKKGLSQLPTKMRLGPFTNMD